MKLNRSTMEVLASILGLIIFVVVIMAAMNYFRQGSEEYAEAQRVAGRPITLAESLSGSEGVTETAGVEGASAITATTPVTDTIAVTGTTAVTTTETVTTTEVAATTPLSETAAVTTTSETTATAGVAESAPVTDSAPVEVAAAVTTTETVTESTEVAAVPTVAPTAEPTVAPTAEPTVAPTEAAPAAAPAVVGVPAAADVAPIFAKGTCTACHTIADIPGAVGMIGPNLSELGAVAGTRIPGYTAEQYIRESIMNPNAFIAPECPTGACMAGLMLQNLAEILTPEEIDLVVAYLAAQGVQ